MGLKFNLKDKYQQLKMLNWHKIKQFGMYNECPLAVSKNMNFSIIPLPPPLCWWARCLYSYEPDALNLMYLP